MKAARRQPRERRPTSGRTTELALIHIAAEQLGLRKPGDDSAYRDMLWSIGRVRSAADLDTHGRQAVLDHLRNCGWQHKAPPGRVRYIKGTPEALIRWLWSELHRQGKVRENTDRALRRYIAQHAGIREPGAVDEIAPQHLSRAEINTVIEQLKRWADRAAAAKQGDPQP